MLGTWRCASLCHVLASLRFNRHRNAQSQFFFFFSFQYRSSLILSLQIHPPVFSLVIKSCQAEAGLHSIIPRSSHIWCSDEESTYNTRHLLSAKYVGEFCRIFTQSHSVPFINYHITKEAHLLCMVCCLGALLIAPYKAGGGALDSDVCWSEPTVSGKPDHHLSGFLRDPDGEYYTRQC